MTTPIAEARVLVVGVGAIGGPVALALASGGVGRVRFCDADVIELSNLQRQVQFTAADIGASKAQTLAARLIGRGVAAERVEAIESRFDSATIEELLAGVDLVIDGSDNFATKFAVSDAAAARQIPAIVASAVATSGQLFVSVPDGPCYRCLFESPPANDRGNCAQIGILAPIPGIVAGHATTVALAILRGEPAPAPLAVFEHTATEPRWIELERRADCPSHHTLNPDKGTTHGNRSNSDSPA